MFNMSRALLLAGMRLGIPSALQLMAPPTPGGFLPGRRIAKKGSGAKGSRDRLHPDRSSSVRKLQRWHRNGDIAEFKP